MTQSYCNTFIKAGRTFWLLEALGVETKTAHSGACAIIHVSIHLLGKQICSLKLQLRLWKWLSLTLEAFASSVSS